MYNEKLYKEIVAVKELLASDEFGNVLEEMTYDEEIGNLLTTLIRRIDRHTKGYIIKRKALIAVFVTGTFQEDMRWGYLFHMPATADALHCAENYVRPFMRRRKKCRRLALTVITDAGNREVEERGVPVRM